MTMTHSERRAHRASAAKLAAEGMSAEDIAQRMRRTVSWVTGACREHGVPAPSASRAQVLAEEAQRMADDGMEAWQIGRVLNRSMTWVYNACRAQGTAPMPASRRGPSRALAILAEVACKGCTQSEAARNLRVSRQRVHQIVEEARSLGLLEGRQVAG